MKFIWKIVKCYAPSLDILDPKKDNDCDDAPDQV